MHMKPIRFFIGTDVNGGCAECQMVLEYSIKKHCSVPYEIYWMKLSEDENSIWGGWNTEQFHTPFSPFRYVIPEFVRWEGKAIYQDDDQLWLSDPLELWNIALDGSNVMTGKQLPNGEIRHCVSLIDCEKFKGIFSAPINRRKKNPEFAEYMKRLTFPHTQIINPNFNNYDGENAEIKDIKVLHFTDMATNPGVKLAVERLGDQRLHWYDGQILKHRRPDVVKVFETYYNEAIKSGMSVADYVPNRRWEYKKLSQKNYRSNNGYDVRLSQ
jgi:hypothetical protein